MATSAGVQSVWMMIIGVRIIENPLYGIFIDMATVVFVDMATVVFVDMATSVFITTLPFVAGDILALG